MKGAALLLGLCLLACGPEDAPSPSASPGPGPALAADRAPAEVLRERVEETYGEDRAAALHKLIGLGAPAEETLRGLLSRPELRPDVLPALLLQPEAALPLLDAVAACLQDEAMLNRWNAARLLGAMGERGVPAVDALADALADGRVEVRIAAATALGDIGPGAAKSIHHLVAMCESKPVARHSAGDPRAAALRALLAMGPPAGPAAQRILAWAIADESPEMLAAAREAQAVLDPWAGLNSTDSEVRLRALSSLRDQPIEVKRLPRLIELLSSESWDVGYRAADLLVRQGAAAIAPLREAHKNARDKTQRMRLLRLLLQLGGAPPGTYGILDRDLDSKRPDYNTLDLLGRLGKEARPSVPKIAPYLDSEETYTRESAITALGRIGGAAAAGSLAARLTAASHEDCERIIDALIAIGADAGPAVPALRELSQRDPVRDLQLRASAAIVRIGSGDTAAIARILELLKTGDHTRRKAAIGTLGALGPLARPALPYLEKCELPPGSEDLVESCRRAAKLIRGEEKPR